jgi:cyclopropane fatty-acyl-phospholipid synthase-like methyltransferase
VGGRPRRRISRHCLLRNLLLAFAVWSVWRGPGWAVARVLLWTALAVEVAVELLHQCGYSLDPYMHKVLNYYRWADPLWSSPHIRNGGYDHFTEGLLDPVLGPHQPLAETHPQKFRWMWERCGGVRGLRVLDVGCGNGAFLRYLRAQGAEAVGLTPSPPQVRGLRAAGLDAHPVDVWDLDRHPELHGRFDAVVMNGSTEHFLNVSQYDPAVQRTRFARCFALLRRCLDPASPHRRCVITAIGSHRDIGRWEWVQAYLLERSYGGRYVAPDLYTAAAADAGWRCLETENRTLDYYIWARKVWYHAYVGLLSDPNTLGRVLVDVPVFLCNDPYYVHRLLHCVLGTWSWQFAVPGSPLFAPAEDPPCRHQWLVYEAA